ncbi:MAG: TMEM165/GDT1 family protein [Actinobacteria bacterium]|nr:TMEM165/GDT1 family protein [Actinomycetota bacterium]
MELATIATVFVVIALAKLPDKTMIATLIMGSRARAGAVAIGTSAAFVVHMAIAVIAGQFLTLLPHRILEAVVTILFLGGAAYLLFVPEKEEIEKGEAEASAEVPSTALREAVTAFTVIFIGEWGDLSQLLAANFVAQTQQPYAVFLGASLALITVATAAAFGGRALLKIIPLSVIRRGGGFVLLGFGIWNLVKVIHG